MSNTDIVFSLIEDPAGTVVVAPYKYRLLEGEVYRAVNYDRPRLIWCKEDKLTEDYKMLS